MMYVSGIETTNQTVSEIDELMNWLDVNLCSTGTVAATNDWSADDIP